MYVLGVGCFAAHFFLASSPQSNQEVDPQETPYDFPLAGKQPALTDFLFALAIFDSIFDNQMRTNG
jgi:hypothetical protein